MSIDVIALPINDVARALGVGRTTIYKLIGEKRLATIKIGRRTLVRADSVRSLVEGA